MQTLKEIMTSNVDVISRNASAEDAALKMKNLNVGALPIYDGEKLFGMVTDRDLVMRVMAEGLDPKRVNVSEAASSEVLFCYEDEDIDKATHVMSQGQIRRLPILSRAKTLVGIVSLGDLAVHGNDAQTSGEVLERVSSPSRSRLAPRKDRLENAAVNEVLKACVANPLRGTVVIDLAQLN